MNSDRQHIEWLDLAKILTMILVIIGHSNYYHITTQYGGINYPIKEDSFGTGFIRQLVGFIYTFHMPAFMALSGAAFSFAFSKFDSLSSLARNRVKRLLVPFALVTFLFSVPCKLSGNYWSDSIFIFQDIMMGQFLLLGNSHLWFIVSLFYVTMVFFIISPYKNRSNEFIFWSLLTIISLAGFYCEQHFKYLGSFFGIWGMLKHLLFFSIGFYCIKWIENKFVSIWLNLICWIGMFGLYRINSLYPPPIVYQ